MSAPLRHPDPPLEFRSLDDAAAVANAQRDTLLELAFEVSYYRKAFDTLNTPWWRRVLYRLDGWPKWSIVADGRPGMPNRPAWRPWRRWWTS